MIRLIACSHIRENIIKEFAIIQLQFIINNIFLLKKNINICTIIIRKRRSVIYEKKFILTGLIIGLLGTSLIGCNNNINIIEETNPFNNKIESL